MNELWAKKLLDGTKTWKGVPAARKPAVKAILEQKYKDKEITKKQLTALTTE